MEPVASIRPTYTDRVARWTVVPAGSRERSKRRYVVFVALTARAGSDPRGRVAEGSAVESATRGAASVQPGTGSPRGSRSHEQPHPRPSHLPPRRVRWGRECIRGGQDLSMMRLPLAIEDATRGRCASAARPFAPEAHRREPSAPGSRRAARTWARGPRDRPAVFSTRLRRSSRRRISTESDRRWPRASSGPP